MFFGIGQIFCKKITHSQEDIQRHIQSLIKHLRWSFFVKIVNGKKLHIRQGFLTGFLISLCITTVKKAWPFLNWVNAKRPCPLGSQSWHNCWGRHNLLINSSNKLRTILIYFPTWQNISDMRVYKLQTRTEAVQSCRVLIYFLSSHTLFRFNFEKKNCLSLQKKFFLGRTNLFNTKIQDISKP